MTHPRTRYGEVRRAAGLHVATLALMTGIADDRLRQIEAGARPSPEELDAWTRAFGVRIEDLGGGDPSSWPLARLAFRASADQAPGLESLVGDGS